MNTETHMWLVCGPSQPSARFRRDSTSATSERPRGTQGQPAQASDKPGSSGVAIDAPEPTPRRAASGAAPLCAISSIDWAILQRVEVG